MSKLKEIRAAMPADFVDEFRKKAESYGLTPRQLAATCIAMGFKSFCVLSRIYAKPSTDKSAKLRLIPQPKSERD